MPDLSPYSVPAEAAEVVSEIKRSRFIAHIAHCSNSREAFEIIKQAKIRYPGAHHHCWAFIAGPPHSASSVRFNDAGEPSGTAGKPILKILQYSHYGEIICVVSRYFGGIKLGAGGLVRAYSGSTKAALDELNVKEIIEVILIQLQFPYPFESSIRHYLGSLEVVIDQVIYQEQVMFQLKVDKTLIKQIDHHTRNLCKGDVILSKAKK